MATPFGPTGEAVYKRTYSRELKPGVFEDWPDTVYRVVYGNLALVYGKDVSKWSKEVVHEAERLMYYMNRFAIIPAGRQLWATGVPGRQFLFNCHVSGWGEKFSEHFSFTFMRLVEGGGVGANYSTRLFEKYGAPKHPVTLMLTADGSHKDYDKMKQYLVDPDYFDIEDPDYVEDTREGWAAAIEHVIDAAMSVYGTPNRRVTLNLDLSKIRPEGSPLVSSGGVAAGPAPLAKMLTEVVATINSAWESGRFTPMHIMEMDHSISVGAVAGGKRRSARMSICHWKDPYIFDFIKSKADGSKFWTTNISVEIDDEFIENINRKHDDGRYYGLFAQQVLIEVTKAMLANGEPGFWNSSLSKMGETGEIIATNPCGEIALEAWEACNLGHVNLDYFVDKDRALGYDYAGLCEAHRLITRFLMRSTYSDINDPRQREIQDRNRRIGVGHLGVQAFFAKALEIKYSQIAKPGHGGGMLEPASILRRLKQAVDVEAIEYAHELRIPVPVKRTTVAPTGSVAKLPGTTEGISAIYARWFEQRVRFSLRDEREFEMVSDYRAQGFKVEDDVYDESGMTAVVVFPTENLLITQVRELGLDPELVESQEQISVRDMLELQAFYQKWWADNAVSYTVNIPEGTVAYDELAELLREYLPNLKGTTIMVDASREQAPYTRITESEYTVAEAKRQADALDLECSTGACPIR